MEKKVVNKIMMLGLLLTVAGAFAAQQAEGVLGGRMILASQAAMELSREFKFSEDQQKILSDRLNEMAESGGARGYVEINVARSVAEGIQALPTQAGPAPAMVGEAEEKEGQEGEKRGKAIGKTVEREHIERVVQDFLPPEGVKTLVGSYLFRSVTPWNIQFKPGEISRVLKDKKGLNDGVSRGDLSACANGRYLLFIRISELLKFGICKQ